MVDEKHNIEPRISFSHARTKPVVVEKLKRGTTAPTALICPTCQNEACAIHRITEAYGVVSELCQVGRLSWRPRHFDSIGAFGATQRKKLNVIAPTIAKLVMISNRSKAFSTRLGVRMVVLPPVSIRHHVTRLTLLFQDCG
jgi:hypothetical protein